MELKAIIAKTDNEVIGKYTGKTFKRLKVILKAKRAGEKWTNHRKWYFILSFIILSCVLLLVFKEYGTVMKLFFCSITGISAFSLLYLNYSAYWKFTYPYSTWKNETLFICEDGICYSYCNKGKNRHERILKIKKYHGHDMRYFWIPIRNIKAIEMSDDFVNIIGNGEIRYIGPHPKTRKRCELNRKTISMKFLLNFNDNEIVKKQLLEIDRNIPEVIKNTIPKFETIS